ncbi:tyrosine-type recombinase/integrase [Geodermatophilus marinus]|uniref:tyrosine-type recombinase/integrase n=1 Tax=Geodermatophilus sp. LHW52908 TaxID=2303986 RepID=UPI000E3CF9E2|nr:tyrosine-type recombinase/integrase [Geodermatophilus sp. LHW52908]RFU22753.1 site-specific integrase [Geodermatophilus sp. LHW52908]
MAKVYRRVRPRAGKPDLVTYEARWREPDGRQRKRSFRKKSDAERYKTSIESSLLTGGYVDPTRARVTVGAYAEQWMGGRTALKPKTIASYRTLLNNRVLPRWGGVRLDRVTYEDVAAWVAEMSTALSPSTTRQAYQLLTSMLDQAVKGRRLAMNPAAGVELPRLPRKSRRYLSHEEVGRLADACREDGIIVLMLAYTGIRWGELAAIRVRCVAPGVRRIHIEEAMTEVDGKAVFGSPKTHADRWVAIPGFLRDDISAVMAGKSPDDLLFTSPKGEVLRVGNFRRARFDRATAGVGLVGLVPHELRHTAASLAIASGANVKAVQSMLGHASAAMTLDRYSHLFDDQLESVADRLHEARERRAVPPLCPQGTVTTLADHAAGR